jgi:hypothetical protein
MHGWLDAMHNTEKICGSSIKQIMIYKTAIVGATLS